MRRTKSGTSEHSEGGLNDHRHVNDDTVTHADIELLLENRGESARLIHDLCISPGSLNTRVNAIFVEADAVALPLFDMPIEAVVGNVSHASFVPPMHVLITRVNCGLIQSVPVNLSGFFIEERRLVFN